MADNAGIQEFDVIIVGYGPVGVLAATALAQRGWAVAAIDRMTDVYPLPRAVNFDGEIMRVFQEIGLADTLPEQTEQTLGAEFVDAQRKRINGFDIPPGTVGAHNWPDGNFFHQPTFERTLRAKAADNANVTTFLGYEAAAPQQDSDTVSVKITAGDGGDEITLTAPYLLAADGASSPIRKARDINFNSLGYDCDWLVVDVILDKDVNLPPIPQQICDPARVHTFVPIVGNRRRWEFRLNEGETREEMLEEHKIYELLDPWLKRDEATIERAAVYQFHAATAAKWRDGRIFLMGDAAHQTPPFLGQGMCAGMRDAANLVWKLDLLKQGLVPESILDTYQEERDPHAHDLVDHAVAIGKLMDSLADAQLTGNWPENMDAIYGGSRGFPRLHSGVLAEGSEDDSGKVFGFLFPQADVDLDGTGPKKLDDLYAGNFAVISGKDLTDQISAEHKAFLNKIDAKILTVPENARRSDQLDLMLAFNEAVIVRPDHYIFSVVNADHPLTDQLNQLQSHFI